MQVQVQVQVQVQMRNQQVSGSRVTALFFWKDMISKIPLRRVFISFLRSVRLPERLYRELCRTYSVLDAT